MADKVVDAIRETDNPRKRTHSLRVRILVLSLAFVWLPIHALHAAKVRLQTRTNFTFRNDGVTIDNRFPGARISNCTRIAKHHYRILITPENKPINRSPWYAFRIHSQDTNKVSVTLRYEGAVHRYHPMTSHDGTNWSRLSNSRLKVSPRRTEATLDLPVSVKPTWVSARELLDAARVSTWIRQIAKQPGIEETVIGRSMDKRPIHAVKFGSRSATNLVVIIGRQHPPELSGGIGLMAFVEELLEDSELPQKFRDQLAILAVPLMNPDGVAEGHWRHNLGGVDLNRDWKDFRQPETRIFRNWLEKELKQRNAHPLLFLDFHSTYRDIFYTQKDEHPTIPPDFTKTWLKAIADRLPEYRVSRSASHNMDVPTSKAWAYDRFGCPAITYEFGDHTDRKLVRKQARVAAREMMKLLLQFLREHPHSAE